MVFELICGFEITNDFRNYPFIPWPNCKIYPLQSLMANELLDKREHSGQPLHADRAYRSEAMLTGLNYIVYSNSCLRSFFSLRNYTIAFK